MLAHDRIITAAEEQTLFAAPNPYRHLHPDLPGFSLTSTSFVQGSRLPDLHKAQGQSPQLSWSGFPAATKSFALTCFDPDAPTHSGYWHWAAFNIPTSVTTLELDAGAPGSEFPGKILAGDSGIRGYYGPNPPAGHGPHRYLFAVHALDVPELEIPETATATVLGFNVYFHSLARAVLWGWYEQ